MNLAELLNLALPGGISATGAQGTGNLNASGPNLNGEIGQAGEFAQLLEQAQLTPPVPLEANLAPPGDPPPSETNSGERGELKTNEPNALSKEPDPAQAQITPPQATELMAAWMLAQRNSVPTLSAPVAVPAESVPMTTPAIGAAPVAPNPTQPPQVLPTAPEGVFIAKITAEQALIPVAVPTASNTVEAPELTIQPQAPADVKPQAKAVETEQAKAAPVESPVEAVSPETTKPQPQLTQPAESKEKPELNPLQKGNPVPVQADPLTTPDPVKTADTAKTTEPVQTSEQTEIQKPEPKLTTATEPKEAAAKEAKTLEFSDNSDKSDQPQRERKDNPQAATPQQPVQTNETPVREAKPEPAPRTELQARLDAVAQRAELLHATRHGVKIELHTPDLGAIQLQIQQTGDAVTTRVNTDNPEVRQALISAQPRIEKAMEDRGLSLRDFNVSSTMSDSQHHQPGRHQQSHQPARPMNHQVPAHLLNSAAATTQRPTVSAGRGLDLAI